MKEDPDGLIKAFKRHKMAVIDDFFCNDKYDCCKCSKRHNAIIKLINEDNAAYLVCVEYEENLSFWTTMLTLHGFSSPNQHGIVEMNHESFEKLKHIAIKEDEMKSYLKGDLDGF